MTEPVSLNGHLDPGEPEPEREMDRSLVYEILREFRALSAREE